MSGANQAINLIEIKKFPNNTHNIGLEGLFHNQNGEIKEIYLHRSITSRTLVA